MSTKSTQKYEQDAKTGQGFHVYEEVFDEGNVYLELTGFQFEASTSGTELLNVGGPRVVVKLPVEWAEKLGLVKSPSGT